MQLRDASERLVQKKGKFYIRLQLYKQWIVVRQSQGIELYIVNHNKLVSGEYPTNNWQEVGEWMQWAILTEQIEMSYIMLRQP